MRAMLPTAGEAAISSASASDSDSEITSGLDSDPSDWFGALARPMLGKEPGVALHHTVGPDFPISTCAKYVSKTEASRRQPPGYLIRALLRSPQGAQWLAALMDDCEAQWWREHRRAAELAALAEGFVASVAERRCS